MKVEQRKLASNLLVVYLASLYVQSIIAEKHFLLNLRGEELGKLSPQFPSKSNWQFKSIRGQYHWESCRSGDSATTTDNDKSGQSDDEGEDDAQDWVYSEPFDTVSSANKNLKLYLRISYLFWCPDKSDKSCLNEKVNMVIVTDSNRSKFTMSFREFDYHDPASNSHVLPRSQRISIPKLPKSGKLQLGISAGNYCVKITFIEVYHEVCPEVIMNLAKFPKTFPAVYDDNPGYIETVFGECIANSGLAEGSLYTSSQDCEILGRWLNALPGCKCMPGFEPNKETTSCIECPVGTFKDELSNSHCTKCPINSNSRSIGATKCDCFSQYYRNPDESPSLSCGSRPSKPRNLRKVESVTGDRDTVTLRWSAPIDFGHRPQVHYNVVCERGCLQQDSYAVNATTITLPVNADTLYTFKVYSKNSLSEFFPFEAQPYEEIQFRTAKKYLVSGIGVSAIRGKDNEVRLEWDRPAGYPGNRYCVKISRNLIDTSGIKFDVSCSNHTSSHPYLVLSNLQPGTYQFAIRTEVDGVPGPFSNEIGIEIQDNVIDLGVPHIGLIMGILLTISMLFVILCVGFVLLYKKRNNQYKYDHAAIGSITTVPPNFDLAAAQSGFDANNMAISKLPVGQLFTEPSFYDDTDQILAELTCELDEKFLQLTSEGTPQEHGAIWQGTLFNPINREYNRVQVKALYLNIATPDSARKFAIEAALNGQFQHVNVSAFFGLIYSNSMWMAVSELSERGPLYRVLQEGASTGTLTFATQLSLLKGIVCGMHYLSDFGYVHKVLTSGNVVVNEREIPKISGFDMRALLDESASNSKTFNELCEYLSPWQAPELFPSTTGGSGSKYSNASDVWSFGVIAWEIMSQGQEPYGNMNSQQISEFLQSGQRLSQPKQCSSTLYKMMTDCWAENRSERPWFVKLNEIVTSLFGQHYSNEKLPFKQTLYGSMAEHSNEFYMTLQRASLSSMQQLQSPSPTNTEKSGAPLKPYGPLTVREWLKDISMGQYIEQLENNGYTYVNDLFNVQDSNLKAIGISSVKNRKKILANIALAKIRERKQTNQLPQLTSLI